MDVQNGVAAVDDIIRFWCQLAGGDVGNLKCHLKSHKPISFASSRGWEVTVGPEQPQTMLGIHICHPPVIQRRRGLDTWQHGFSQILILC